jgi:molecular chaperone DnaJ
VRVRDPYEILGVPREASPDDLKAAFRKLAAMHHPDRNPGDAQAPERFKEINAAYQLLSDPKKRAIFDRFGEAGVGAAAGGPFSGVPIDFSQVADMGFDAVLGDLLGAFGFGSKVERGDIRKEITISFEEAAFGCEHELTYERTEVCSDCRGSGSAPGQTTSPCGVCNGRGRVRFQQGFFPVAVERPCSRCHGTGRLVSVPCASCKGEAIARKKKTLVVQIPPGVENNATHVVDHAGHVIRPNRGAGDLELTIRVRPHPFFNRDGDDVVCSVPVTFVQASLGAEVEVPTLDGKGKLRIPAGTQSGAVLRIRGKGVPHKVVGGRGDQLVEVSVEVPERLSPKARELIEQLGQEMGTDHQPLRRTFMEKLRDLFG